MAQIFIPQKQMTIELHSETNLMDALLKAGLPVASSCHGDGICSMCKVTIQGVVTEAQKLELETLKRNKCDPKERLSCQVLVTQDITVTTKYW